MFINVKRLIHLPVFTESGTKLGKIFDVSLDAETHAVREYLVRHLPFGGHTYIIKPAQVIRITAERVVVDDAILRRSAKRGAKDIIPAPTLESATN